MTMPRRAIVSAVLLALCVGLTGCWGGNRDEQKADGLAAALAATRPATPELMQMLGDVAAVRGLPPPVTIRFGTVRREALPTLIDSLLTDDDRKAFSTTTTLYRLLGHLRQDQDYLSVYRALASHSAVGLYSPADDTLWIVDERPVSSFTLKGLTIETTAALAHEMVHAVQDENFALEDLRRATADDLDASLALTSMVEGDAVTHQALYVARFLKQAQTGPSATVSSRPPPRDVPASISRELFFPYTTGAEWVSAILEAGGSSAVDNLLRDPPGTTATILHPALGSRYWSPESVGLPDLSAALGDGWRRESGGTFGEFHLRNYLQLRLPGIPAATAAAGWDGDRYDVYTRGKEGVAVFRIAFADASQASEFAAAHETFLATGGSRRSVTNRLTVTNSPAGATTVTMPANGHEVSFVIGSGEAAATRAASLLQGS